MTPMISDPTPTSSQGKPPPNAAPRILATSDLHPHPSSLTPDEISRRHDQSRKRALLSRGKGKGTPDGTLPKKQRLDTSPAAIVEKAASTGHDATASAFPASRSLAPGSVFPPAGGLLRGEAYALTKSKVSELFVHLNELVSDYDEDVRTRDNELSEVRAANVALQLRLDEVVEMNRVLECDALSVQRKEEEWGAKLTKISSGHAKDKEEIASLKSQLSSANDLQDARVEEAVAKAREEMSRGFVGKVSEVSRILALIDGKAKCDMRDLAEIDANLEFIELLQKPKPPFLEDEIKELYQRQAPIYDARNVFEDLVADVRRVLKISKVSAAATDVEVVATDDEGDEVSGEEGSDKEIDD